ncbi:glycoside hydrolase family 43 protein [Annulohypoxylon truncatum]|uniref:glycoside hydrolase family 43 protein n=1 Tax=Annulohypoxylon truncatum TaxID=327061 RepID=UPI00200809D2|nr:glycoside hydrolase family 43 protein [Annulohypoxylon truncatum]KAI1207321.1 glycoside hydrolase family 43 protein [Annulohypoxylon truncatum]
MTLKWAFLICNLLQFNLARSSAVDHSLQNRVDSFQNPVIYEDFADNDVSVSPDSLYYYSTSNMHYSPSAPILRSGDIVNWELIGHSVHGAFTMRFRKTTRLWYWIGCDVAGPWTKSAVLPGGTCYYDCGLLIDDDDAMYVVYGSTDVSVAQLSEDGLSQAQTYGFYYILDDHLGDITYIWKSDSPWGPYESKVLVDNVKSPLANGGAPHQGGLIQASSGDWYYMPFTWAYPNGCIPVLAPIKWEDDGFPSFYQIGNGSVTLSTATITNDFYAARNTLTHRVHDEFAAFRDRSAYIGIHRDGNKYTISVVHSPTQEELTWNMTSNGTIVTTQTKILPDKTIWLRASLDARASGTYAANFSYSTNGQNFTQLGKTYTMYIGWSYFMGYRFGIFNYATKSLGGSVRALSFTSA